MYRVYYALCQSVFFALSAIGLKRPRQSHLLHAHKDLILLDNSATYCLLEAAIERSPTVCHLCFSQEVFKLIKCQINTIWSQHSHFRHIPNNQSFIKKITIAIDCVLETMKHFQGRT